MNTTSRIAILSAAALLVSCASVTKPPSASASLAVANTYVFRGVPQATDGVLQGDMRLSVTDDADSTYTLTGWANMNLSAEGDEGAFNANRDGKVTEFDLVPEYSHKFGDWSAAAGLVNYNFPNQVLSDNSPVPSTTELYASVGHDDFLKPKLTVYYDIEEVEGLYLNAAISHSWDLAEGLALEAGVSLGFANDRMGNAYWLEGSTGFTDLVGHVGLGYAVTKHCALTGAVYASRLLDNRFRDSIDAAGFDEDNLWFLVGSAWSF